MSFMYVVAFLSFASTVAAVVMACLWARAINARAVAKRRPHEHWTVHRAWQAKERTARLSAACLATAAILLQGVAELLR